MRALGPGSVSSFLKVILDVVHWVLVVAAGGMAVAVLVALLLSFNPALLGGAVNIDNLHINGPWLGPLLAGVLLAIDLYIVGALIITGRLRRIFQTLIVGDPFDPGNVLRLRVIGGALAGLEVGGYVFGVLERVVVHGLGLTHVQTQGWSRPTFGGVHLTAWFSVLVIVVLAEVFREGARLRREAELTI